MQKYCFVLIPIFLTLFSTIAQARPSYGKVDRIIEANDGKRITLARSYADGSTEINSVQLFLISFSVFNLLGCLDGKNMQIKEIKVLDYRIIPLDVFVKNKDSISVLGYRFSDLDGYAFAPVTIKSNDGGKTWNLKVFPDAKNMPRFFRYSKYVFLYNYEKEETWASVYISEDSGNSWNLFGEQDLLICEIPVFGNLDVKNPEVHQINKIIADDSWYVEEEPLYTNFIVRKGNPAFTSQVGRINRYDGSSTIIDVKQDVHSTLMFYDEEN